MANEFDKSQSGGGIAGLELLSLLSRGDTGRSQTGGMSQNDYYPSQTSPGLKGYFRGGDISLPIFATAARMPFARMDKARDIAAATKAAKTPPLNVSPPKTWDAYQGYLSNSYYKDLENTTRKLQKEYPKDWQQVARLPGGEIDKLNDQYGAFAEKIERYKTRVETLQEQYKGKIIPEDIRRSINDFYVKTESFFGKNDNTIEKMNELGETLFTPATNLLELYDLVDVNDLMNESPEPYTDPLTQSVMQRKIKKIDPIAARTQAKLLVNAAYSTFAENRKFKKHNLPNTLEEFYALPETKQNEMYDDIAGDFASTNMMELDKLADIPKGTKQLEEEAAAKARGTAKGGAGKTIPTVQQQATPYTQKMTQATTINYRNPESGKVTAKTSDEFSFDKSWDLSANKVEDVSITSDLIYSISDNTALKPTETIKGNVVRVAKGIDPFSKDTSGDEKYFLFVETPAYEVMETTTIDPLFETERTSTRMGVSKRKGEIVMVPVDDLSMLQGKVNIQDAETNDVFLGPATNASNGDMKTIEGQKYRAVTAPDGTLKWKAVK